MSSITVGVYLGKKDRLVRYWYEVLPKGQFPMLVKYCIQSYLRNTYFPLNSVCDPGILKDYVHSREEYLPTQRNVTFNAEDGSVYNWIKGLESGYRSEEIKNILKDTVIHTLLYDQASFPAHTTPTSQPVYPRQARVYDPAVAATLGDEIGQNNDGVVYSNSSETKAEEAPIARNVPLHI
jgi:hypothetical protein